MGKEHYYDKLIGLVLNIVMGPKIFSYLCNNQDILKEFWSILEATKHRIDLSLVKLSYRGG